MKYTFRGSKNTTDIDMVKTTTIVILLVALVSSVLLVLMCIVSVESLVKQLVAYINEIYKLFEKRIINKCILYLK